MQSYRSGTCTASDPWDTSRTCKFAPPGIVSDALLHGVRRVVVDVAGYVDQSLFGVLERAVPLLERDGKYAKLQGGSEFPLKKNVAQRLLAIGSC